MMKLLTIEEVAEMLRRSPRTVLKLAIPVVRLTGRARLYDPRDVRDYIEGCKQYPSSSGRGLPTTRRSLNTKGVGLSEALALYPAEKPKPSSDDHVAPLAPRRRAV
jgi:hypothetical protein